MAEINRTGALLGKVIIKGKIELLTGMRIGTQAELRIGGIDNPVIRDPLTYEPYIPGSSLKGKLRSIAERKLFFKRVRDNIEDGVKSFFAPRRPVKIHECDQDDCPVCSLFGTAENKRPSRIIVRDSFLTEESRKKMQDAGISGFTELKTENALDRLTAEANPRTNERVPRGAEFEFEIIYDIDRTGFVKMNLGELFEDLRLLEYEGLGGSTSRGYGQIKIKDISVKLVVVKDGELVPDEILIEDGAKELKDIDVEGLTEKILEKVVADALGGDAEKEKEFIKAVKSLSEGGQR